ncbi:hypothetical protein [Mesorhizobium sp. WSM2240]
MFDGGGLVHEYQTAAAQAVEHNVQITIDGSCYSACTLFADMARDQVCVTPRTRFYIHQATDHPSGNRTPVQYSPGFHIYIGPQPTEGWLVLDYDDLRKFWRTCP